MSSYGPGRPGREDHNAIGVDEQGNEHVLPLLVAGPGGESVNPEPGSQGWQEIVQSGVNAAAAAVPPNEQELAIWRLVAEKQLPLDFVRRDDATLTLRVPSSWGSGIAGVEGLMVATTVPGTFDGVELRDPRPTPYPADLTEVLLEALDEAAFTVTVSRHVEQAVHQGDTHIYPWAQWAQLVEAALEAVVARLLPEEDGVVVGHVAQALALLARAKG